MTTDTVDVQKEKEGGRQSQIEYKEMQKMKERKKYRKTERDGKGVEQVIDEQREM